MGTEVNDKASLLIRLHENRDQIQSFGVKKLSLFGSFARDERIHKKSDVDFLVDFKKGSHKFDNFMELAFFLEDLLGRRVELLTRKSLSPYIGPKILKAAVNVI